MLSEAIRSTAVQTSFMSSLSVLPLKRLREDSASDGIDGGSSLSSRDYFLITAHSICFIPLTPQQHADMICHEHVLFRTDIVTVTRAVSLVGNRQLRLEGIV